MCWGKAEYEFGAWKGRMAEETPDQEREEPRVTWKASEEELVAEEREREETLERV